MSGKPVAVGMILDDMTVDHKDLQVKTEVVGDTQMDVRNSEPLSKSVTGSWMSRSVGCCGTLGAE